MAGSYSRTTRRIPIHEYVSKAKILISDPGTAPKKSGSHFVNMTACFRSVLFGKVSASACPLDAQANLGPAADRPPWAVSYCDFIAPHLPNLSQTVLVDLLRVSVCASVGLGGEVLLQWAWAQLKQLVLRELQASHSCSGSHL